MAYDGDPRRGPGLQEILDGVAESRVLARPIAGARTICELVRHLSAGKSAVADWLNGSTREVSPEQNFPPNADWPSMFARLHQAQADLLAAVAVLDPKRLAEMGRVLLRSCFPGC